MDSDDSRNDDSRRDTSRDTCYVGERDESRHVPLRGNVFRESSSALPDSDDSRACPLCGSLDVRHRGGAARSCGLCYGRWSVSSTGETVSAWARWLESRKLTQRTFDRRGNRAARTTGQQRTFDPLSHVAHGDMPQ